MPLIELRRLSPGGNAPHRFGGEPRKSPLPLLVRLRATDFQNTAAFIMNGNGLDGDGDELGDAQARIVAQRNQRSIAKAGKIGATDLEQAGDSEAGDRNAAALIAQVWRAKVECSGVKFGQHWAPK
jgi:hypothetical protein